ncbi:MAG: lysophospholipid acyltransferase family protein [Mediterranea sp.]|nr:lysophospholipid acyltransferase family protein [Mediterranea sp.]
MEKFSQAILYYLLYGSCYLLSLVPLRGLYVLSDGLYYLIYYVTRYRRKVVRKNLTNSFPEKKVIEIAVIEKKFYAMLCDYFFESIKLAGISKREILRRMSFEGLERVDELAGEGRSAAFYLSHTFNWEWITSFPMHIHSKGVVFGQIYHKLANKAFDRLFLKLRKRFGAISIPMPDTARVMMSYKKEEKPVIIGFIADQAPKLHTVDHWVDFLHQDTAVITGTERIIKKLNCVAVFCSMVSEKRGYYVCKVERVIEETCNIPDYELTDMYYKHLEETIRKYPSSWLWTHKRWKRTKEEFEQYKLEQEIAKKKRLEQTEEEQA